MADGGVLTGRVLADRGVGPQSASACWIGQKAANLAWLAGHGHRVPPFFVLSSGVCARLLAPAKAEVDAVLAGLDGADPASLLGASLEVEVAPADGSGSRGTMTIPVTIRIDTPTEAAYYEHGGILPYVLRQHMASAG